MRRLGRVGVLVLLSWAAFPSNASAQAPAGTYTCTFYGARYVGTGWNQNGRTFAHTHADMGVAQSTARKQCQDDYLREGRDPTLLSQQSVDFFGAATTYLAAMDSSVFVATTNGDIVQLALFGDSLNAINFIHVPSVVTSEMRRPLAVTHGVLLFGGGLGGGASVTEVPIFDKGGFEAAVPVAGPLAPSARTFGPSPLGKAPVGVGVREGEWGALGYGGTVASRGGLAIAPNADGNLVALEPRGDDGGPTLARLPLPGGEFMQPVVASGIAVDERMALLTGPRLRLRSVGIGDVATFAEPPDDSGDGALGVLRSAPTERRVTLVDGFAWVVAAQGIAGLLRLLPITRSRGQCFVPADILAASGATAQTLLDGTDDAALGRIVEAMSALARDHLAAFRRTAIPQVLRPAFLPVALTGAYLDAIDRLGAAAAHEIADIPSWKRHWLLFRAAGRGF